MSSSAAQLTVPGRSHGLADVLRRRFLLRLIVRKELRVRYRGSVLGMAWSYVKPAVQFVVYFLAMGVFLKLRDQVPDYAVYLFAGIVVMNYFGEGFGNATRSIVWNAPLINKIYLPRELFPAASLWVSAVHFFPQLVVLMIAGVISGWRPTVAELAAGLLGFVVVSVLTLGLGLLFGSINVFYRDSENVVDLIVMVATWASPVLYTWGRVHAVAPTWLWYLYQANPLTAAVELFHYAFWWGGAGRPPLMPDGTQTLPDHLWLVGLVGLVISAVALGLGQLTFRRLEGRFAQEL